jgi:hypothetical protein
MRIPKWIDLPEVRRWATLRCEHCGHRFRWKRDARHSFGGNQAVYHQYCMGYITWRRTAEERLYILAVTADLAGLTERDVTIALELLARDEAERTTESNRAWRVFRDLRAADLLPTPAPESETER